MRALTPFLILLALLTLTACSGVTTYYVHEPSGKWERVECQDAWYEGRLADKIYVCEERHVSANEVNAYR